MTANRSFIESMTTETISLQQQQELNRQELSDHIAKQILNSENLDIILRDGNIDKSIMEIDLNLDHNDHDNVLDEDDDKKKDQDVIDIDHDLHAMITSLQYKDSNLEHFQTHKQITTQVSMAFDGPSPLDLFAVFDHAKDEILAVLNDSYQRFACTQEYAQIAPKIIKNLNKKSKLKRGIVSGAKMLIKSVVEKRSSTNNLHVAITKINHSPNSVASRSSKSGANIIVYSPTPSQSHDNNNNNNKW